MESKRPETSDELFVTPGGLFYNHIMFGFVPLYGIGNVADEGETLQLAWNDTHPTDEERELMMRYE